ncbi:hypothetical protein GQX74_010163 [Glossina fuscipes]|nr:hypothetical protein GQX74_010163 [Glossina fuscipes]
MGLAENEKTYRKRSTVVSKIIRCHNLSTTEAKGPNGSNSCTKSELTTHVVACVTGATSTLMQSCSNLENLMSPRVLTHSLLQELKSRLTSRSFCPIFWIAEASSIPPISISKLINDLPNASTASSTEKAPSLRRVELNSTVFEFQSTSGVVIVNGIGLPIAIFFLLQTRTAVFKDIMMKTTARVRIIAANGNSAKFRAILDPGSSVNLLFERLVRKLGASTCETSPLIDGVKNACSKQVEVLIADDK